MTSSWEFSNLRLRRHIQGSELIKIYCYCEKIHAHAGTLDNFFTSACTLLAMYVWRCRCSSPPVLLLCENFICTFFVVYRLHLFSFFRIDKQGGRKCFSRIILVQYIFCRRRSCRHRFNRDLCCYVQNFLITSQYEPYITLLLCAFCSPASFCSNIRSTCCGKRSLLLQLIVRVKISPFSFTWRKAVKRRTKKKCKRIYMKVLWTNLTCLDRMKLE